MSRTIWRTAPIGIVLVLLLQAEAGAAGMKSVTISDAGSFQPPTVTAKLNNKIVWTNNGPTSHTTTSDTVNPDGSVGIGLWDSGSLGVGATFTWVLIASGRYPYQCTIHPSMVGTVSSAPMRIAPPSGPVGTIFTITVAATAAPTGFIFDVQKADPGMGFKPWVSNTAATDTFIPTAAGNYKFRARMRRLSTNGASLYSVVTVLVVS